MEIPAIYGIYHFLVSVHDPGADLQSVFKGHPGAVRRTAGSLLRARLLAADPVQ